jgi:catechol-2,3-dioxygenase
MFISMCSTLLPESDNNGIEQYADSRDSWNLKSQGTVMD